jgi:endonuclease YncB( thermonuclease family)
VSRISVPLIVAALLSLAWPEKTGAQEGQLPDGAERVELVEVIDGDTFDADFELGRGERISRVRLIGIDTPETSYSYGNQPECFGERAKAEVVRRLAEAAEIWLEADVSESDDKGRLLRYVWLVDESGDVHFLNEDLVRGGFAEAKSYRPNTSRQRQLDRAEGDAIDANAGLWAGCDAQGNSYADPVDDSDGGGAPIPDGAEAACEVFASFDDAQIFYQVFPEIADQVDPDGNGIACETWFGV